ncbi:MAG: hypothetical protein LBN22_10010, partial [Clostridiales Family XIII bacterium]|nr:hypothetical protein [Clostridiales Family XIII bacterium]
KEKSKIAKMRGQSDDDAQISLFALIDGGGADSGQVAGVGNDYVGNDYAGNDYAGNDYDDEPDVQIETIVVPDSTLDALKARIMEIDLLELTPGRAIMLIEELKELVK